MVLAETTGRGTEEERVVITGTRGSDSMSRVENGEQV